MNSLDGSTHFEGCWRYHDHGAPQAYDVAWIRDGKPYVSSPCGTYGAAELLWLGLLDTPRSEGLYPAALTSLDRVVSISMPGWSMFLDACARLRGAA